MALYGAVFTIIILLLITSGTLGGVVAGALLGASGFVAWWRHA
jgi:hypothetical protein